MRAKILAQAAGAAAPPGEVRALWCPAAADAAPVRVAPQEGRGVMASYTWEQLGVGGDLLAAVRGATRLFHARPGGTAFEPVGPDLPASATSVLEPVGNGFELLLVGSGLSGMASTADLTVCRSEDGRQWEPTGAAVPGLGWVVAAGEVDGRLVVVGGRESGAVVLRRTGSGGWVTVDLATVTAPGPGGGRVHAQAAGIGPLGVVVAAVAVPGDGVAPTGVLPTRLLSSRDGTAWADEDIDELAGARVGAVQRIETTAQRVIVEAQLAGTGSPRQGRPSTGVLLVGTPR